MNKKPIKGYDYKYQIDEFGNIFKNNKSVSTFISKQGYLRVSLNRKKYSVHKLVALNFIGDCNGLQVNHKDGNKLNNHYTNLEYLTPSDNLKHAFSIGLKSNKTFFNNDSKKDALELLRNGKSQKEIAIIFGCSQITISRLKKNN
jgi:hypothetical protein